MQPRASSLSVLCALFLLACSAGGSDRRLRVGQEADAPGGSGGSGGSFGSGAGTSGGGALDGGFVSGENALRVRVQDVEGMTLEVITLACAGDCADIEAVARGGHPPYAYAWEDGSTEPRRRVCLDASSILTVTAVDTAVDVGEFRYDAQTSTAEVTATVLDCSDAGPPVSRGELCFDNPSFEGTPRGLVSTAAPWISCGTFLTDNNVIWDASPYVNGWQLDPRDGETFLVTHTNGGVGTQGASQASCESLPANVAQHLRIDLASPLETGISVPSQPATLQIWAGTAGCARDELLWTSPVLTASWQTLCATLEPSMETTHLTLVPSVPGDPAAPGRVVVDRLVPVDACP